MARKKGLPSYPGSRNLYITLSILSLFEGLFIVAQGIFLARAITFVFQGDPILEVMREFAYFLIAFIARQAFHQLEQHFSERFALRTSQQLRKKLLSAYFSNGYQAARRLGTGRLVTLAVEGIEQVKEYLQLAIPKMIRTLIVPTLIVIYTFTLDKPSAIILIVAVPIIVIFMILLGITAQKVADKQHETYRILSNHFTDSLKGIETLKYLGQSKAHERRIRSVSKDYRKATMKTLRVAFLSSFALDFFTSLSIAFVAVGLGLRLIDGVIPLLPALTILILAPESFLPIKQVGQDYHATLDGQISLADMESIIQSDKKPNMVDAPESIWHPSDKLTLKNLGVQGDGQNILKNFSFSWKGTGKIGLVGKSGAGKSTLIHLLAGLIHPDEGTFSIGQKIYPSLDHAGWQQQIAYIPQHPYIFPMSLANNIRFYEPKATDEQVEEIVRQIGLESLVKSFPKGIHEPIGEGGRSLSGGQEQRIAMARALLSERPIILLDEPTAHLDIETEYALKQVMLDIFKDKLVIFATHRLHWMKDMDYLLVIENEKLVEEGSYDELIQNKGPFSRLTTKWLEGSYDQ